MDLFHNLFSDYLQSFAQLKEQRREQGFLLYGQMVNFLHRLIRRVLQRASLPQEDDRDSIDRSDFVKKELLSNEQFMVKTTVKDRALTVVKAQIDVEKSRKKSGGSRKAATFVIVEEYTPFNEACREFIRQLCLDMLSHITFNSDLVVGLASFDYDVLFTLPKSQSLDCFKLLFKSSGDRKWKSKDLRSTFEDCYIEFLDDLRYVYVDDCGRGPEVEDMITFLSCCPNLERRRHTKMCCLSLSHSTINVPYVGLGPASRNVVAPDLSCVIPPSQYSSLSLSENCSFLSRGEQVKESCEL